MADEGVEAALIAEDPDVCFTVPHFDGYAVTVRQRTVPMHLQGRARSVDRPASYGALVAGAGLGGLLAQRSGITAPFWFAFAGSALFAVLIWGQLAHIAHADEQPRV